MNPAFSDGPRPDVAGSVLGRRGLLRAGFGLAATAALAGCSTGSATSALKPETSTVRFGTIPMLDAAPFYVATTQNLFTQRGLTVNQTLTNGGDQSLPMMLQGQLDVIFGNYVTVVNAIDQKQPVRVIADAAAAAPGTFSVVALPHSDIRTPNDLIGRRVAVNTLNNMATALVTAAMANQGVPPSVNFVVFGFPQMEEALRTNKADAAFMPVPFLTQAQKALGVRQVLDPIAGPAAGLPLDGYTTTEKFARENPNTVRIIRDVLQEASRMATKRSVVEAAMVSATGADPTTMALAELPTFSQSLNPTRLQRVADLMLNQGIVQHTVDVHPYVGLPN